MESSATGSVDGNVCGDFKWNDERKNVDGELKTSLNLFVPLDVKSEVVDKTMVLVVFVNNTTDVDVLLHDTKEQARWIVERFATYCNGNSFVCLGFVSSLVIM